jgi:spore germination cell wall hydrolase CwlJ-like protein
MLSKRAYDVRIVALALAASGLAGCATSTPFQASMETNERQCLARVMFFESLRSSDDGMLAVGTVVMNRIASGRYPQSICGTVGQKNQFAPGALTSPFEGAGKARALRVADEVIAGARMPGLENVMFFHTTGYTFPYHNMHYVLVAGGNSFYYKTGDRPWSPNDLPGSPPSQLAYEQTRMASNLTFPTPKAAPDYPRPVPVDPPQPAEPAVAYDPAPAAEPVEDRQAQSPQPAPMRLDPAEPSGVPEPNFQSLY